MWRRPLLGRVRKGHCNLKGGGKDSGRVKKNSLSASLRTEENVIIWQGEERNLYLAV